MFSGFVFCMRVFCWIRSFFLFAEMLESARDRIPERFWMSFYYSGLQGEEVRIKSKP